MIHKHDNAKYIFFFFQSNILVSFSSCKPRHKHTFTLTHKHTYKVEIKTQIMFTYDKINIYL